ncbi:hypothetical protein SAMN05444369_1222 [Capnocytophaga haemolytica]|uniref:Uncharacterized protein n=1 Tax=Capnocytophaga haemolytica TaxID=45243 RepID=A0AAX2H2H8_9FLAO|nr:hypothetical protein [Capnocytophaga haemolytica]AMD86120.1 hypothetical protein AXF12_11750 [Capnocytophaga haemolytica]SFO32796.1 hypothetical protein SAMN05444369_1222 [Capnocytophaga haemolytica]SNV13859.1 Uncharacterised protein [Capnocytophaga haemolytica]
MAEISNNSIIQGISGKFGDEFVFKQRNGKTFISRKPRMPKKRTKDQKKQLSKFAQAAAYSKKARQNPAIQVLYAEIGKEKGLTAHNVAIKDFLTPPTLTHIDLSQYTGAPNQIIIIKALSFVKITQITVEIHDSQGNLIEEGNAVEATHWQYTTTHTNPTLTGSTITVRAYDLPHHHTEETIIWEKQGHKVGALSLKAESDFLEKWELQYLVPKLQLIVNNIKNDKSIKISYSRIENVKKEKSKDWYISTVTPSPWKVNSEEWIDEVVLSIEIEISERNLMINSDISYGTGEIIKKDRFIIDNNTDNKDLDRWLEESASQVISLIKTINRNSD